MRRKYVIKFKDGNYLSKNNSLTKDLFSARLIEGKDKAYSVAKMVAPDCVIYKIVAVTMVEKDE